MKQILKVVLVLAVAGIVMVVSFAAGVFFHANIYAPTQSAASSTSSLPFFPINVNASQTPLITEEDVPPEFVTFWEAWSFLNDQFYGEIPADDARVYGAIRGMVASFDDQHTSFIDPVRAAIATENMTGSFSGIGATVRMDEAGRLIIADPLPDHPAFLAGLRPEDMVLEVDGESLEGLSLFEAVLLIRGPTDSTVVLTIFREGESEPFEVSIVRAEIELEVVESEILEEASDIGYVRLTQFSGGASDKLTDAIEELMDNGASKLIFDLRSNPGGLLTESVNVSSLFIDEGTVVIEKLKGGEEKNFNVKRGLQVAVDVPLVILVNGGSASASEIVAGALQDMERATIIGQQTFGKGSVQLPHRLDDGSELRVTIAEWLTPAGRQIHGEGITPDIDVEMTFEDFEEGLDPQLDEAVEFLNELEQSTE